MWSYGIVRTENVVNNKANNRCPLQLSIIQNLSSAIMHTKIVGAKVGNHTTISHVKVVNCNRE